MSVKTCDIAIIGGGLAGSALAYFLAKGGNKVFILEAGSICSGTSAACAGRAQIIESETPEYLDLVLAGLLRLRGISAELDIDLEWEIPGHITLLFNGDQWRQYEALTKRLNNHGVDANMLDLSSLKKAEPYLKAESCIGAAYSQEGHLNPFKLCLGFANSARRKGAALLTNTSITGFEIRANKITRIRSGNDGYSADVVILAAGAWSGKLARLAGCTLPMRFTHAEAFVTESIPRVIHHHIGISGFYEAVHGSERTVTLGLGQHPNGTLVVSNAIQQGNDIDKVSSAWGMPAIAHAFRKFFPALDRVRIMRTWAMPSPFLPDFLPAIGWFPEVENLYAAAGFHLAVPTIPLLAETIANSILHSDDQPSIPILSPFSPKRFVEQE